MTETRLAGLYAITPTAAPHSLEADVTAALRGGARVLQYRDKGSADDVRREQATRLRELCREHEALLLINDDVALAQAVGADGVHLGQSDMPLAEARRVLGPAAIIGITCHADLDLARAAEAGGADYVAFGRFFPSRSKPQAPPAPLSLLARARRELAVPIVAIGGISPENGAQLLAAGADMLAVIDGVFGQPDVAQAARAFALLFEQTEPNYSKESP